MKSNLLLFVLAIVLVFNNQSMANKPQKGRLIRPLQIDAKVEGARIAEPGDYDIVVGDMIELEYSFPVIPSAIPSSLVAKGFDDELLIGDITAKDVVVPGLVGDGRKVFRFRAMKAGSTNVTLDIDGKEYLYSLTVKPTDGKLGLREPCDGIFTAVQANGRVYIFANGVTSTAGVRVFFEKAKIAIWPPRFSLICEKPLRPVAQVLTPFSIHTSFEAADPVKAVIVSDANGEQHLRVIQLK